MGQMGVLEVEATGFQAPEQGFNGLITNDKFCLIRTGRLVLSWWTGRCSSAGLGGYLDRQCDGPPGPQAIWIGLQRARDLAWGMQSASDLHTASSG